MNNFIEELKSFIEDDNKKGNFDVSLRKAHEKILFVTSSNYLISKFFFKTVKTFSEENKLCILENSPMYVSMENSLDDFFSLLKLSCTYQKPHVVMLNNHDIFFDDSMCKTLSKELIDFIYSSSNNLKCVVVLTNKMKTIYPFLKKDPSHLKINQSYCLTEYVCCEPQEKTSEEILHDSMSCLNDTMRCNYY